MKKTKNIIWIIALILVIGNFGDGAKVSEKRKGEKSE